jgi:flavin-dependent dehydrogenase
MEDHSFDVVVCGGGLAGLTFARQLRLEVPELSIAIVEPQRRPLPEACHKVGESSVELATHYFGKFLELEEYFTKEHLPKNGLRFFSGPPGTPVWQRTEIGPSEFPIVPSYQIDRGKLENDLRAMLEADGVTLREGYKVTDIHVNRDGGHRVDAIVAAGGDGDAITLRARWVVDASGRRQLLQRKYDLRRPSRQRASAAWFRIGRRLKVRELVPASEERWHQRDVDDTRWLSTVHLCGPGYWVWLIPLSTGHTSVGIVTDHVHHDFTDYNKPERALDWLTKHEPWLREQLRDDELEDFLVLRDYSYSSAQVFSEDRWACVGEAGLFADPLYSPGSDLIALANSLTCELIRRDVRDGELDPERVGQYNRIQISWCTDTTRMLADNGVIFVHPEVFAAKLWWDFFHYWTFICPYFFARGYRLPSERLGPVHDVGDRYIVLNGRAQELFEQWAALMEPAVPGGARRPFVPLPMFPSFLADQHITLQQNRAPEEAAAKAVADVPREEELLAEMLLRALRSLGPDKARVLAERIDLASWDLPMSAERLAVERADRKRRRQKLPELARDLERALGKPADVAIPLESLLEGAGWRVSSAAHRANGGEANLHRLR